MQVNYVEFTCPTRGGNEGDMLGRVKIGIDAAPLGSPSGGIKRYTEELIRGLPRLESQHQYVLYRTPKNSRSRMRTSRNQLDPMGFPAKRFLDSIHLLGARDTIDLYHGTNYSIPFFSQIPTVVTVHDLTVQLVPESHPLRRRIRHRLLPAICHRATRIIADSRQTREDLVRLFALDEGKIDVIHLGVGQDFGPIADSTDLSVVRTRYRLPPQFILYLGALEPRKNVESLIDACVVLKGRESGETLVIAGSGSESYETKLRTHALEAGLTLDRDIHFLGHVEDCDLRNLYCASKLFVFPSRYEGFGLPPLEAMACGVPVVMPRNSSLAEVYDGVCAMAESADPVTLANAIRATLDDPSRREELSRRGLEFARSRRWDKVCAETLVTYERAMKADSVASAQRRS